MRDFALTFNDQGSVGIDWSGAVSGIHNAKQKLINNLLTDLGSDDIVPARGTGLQRAVSGGGVYDLRSAQHALNFAALAARRTVRENTPLAALPTDRVVSFGALFDGVVDGALITQLTLTTADGTSLGVAQTIL